MSQIAIVVSDWPKFVTQRPLAGLAVAIGAGFVLGGGARSRLGLSLVGVAVRMGVRWATADFIKQAVCHERTRRNSSD